VSSRPGAQSEPRKKSLEFHPAPPDKAVKGCIPMMLRSGTIEVCTDRELLALALERIMADQFRCERCSSERVAANRAPESDCPAAIVFDLPHKPLRSFTQSPGGVPVIAWQRSTASEPALNALDSGAAGVLNDVSSAEDVLACLKAVTSGLRWVPPSVTQAVLNTRRCHLSRREGQLLKLIAQGLRNKEIAFALSITEGTVKVYLSRLFSKVGVSDRFELALLGLRHSGHESADHAAGEPRIEAGSKPLDAVYLHRDIMPPRPMPAPYQNGRSPNTLH
jgi:DNA-binding NarL/FixJ family response regulator